MLIDTHGHLNFKAFNEDRAEVIERIRKTPMQVVMPSSQYQTSSQAVELAKQHDFLFAAIGIHPIHVWQEEFDQAKYQSLIDSGQVTAIGETGLDYFHFGNPDKPFDETKKKQFALFNNFIKLALADDLPLIVHGRFSDEHPEAYQDILSVLQSQKVKRAVIHCYTGYPDDAQKFIEAGYCLGFTGIITFDKTGNLESVVRETPIEQILIETDAPYLTPEPYRGKRNEPTYVIEVARKIAEIKQLELEQVVEQVNANAKKHFKI